MLIGSAPRRRPPGGPHLDYNVTYRADVRRVCFESREFPAQKENTMNKHPSPMVSRLSMSLIATGLVVLSSGTLANNYANTFFEVTVRPGASVTCGSSPCTVYFEAPAGSGTHNILQNGTVNAGVAIGGQRVLLGEYFAHSTVFHVEGTDLPAADLSVVGGPE
jgi:hypothetical protein